MAADFDRHQEVLQTLANDVIVVDRDHRIVYVNHHGGAGYKAEDVLGRVIDNFVAPEHQQTARGIRERVFATGNHERADIPIRTPDGELRIYNTLYQPLGNTRPPDHVVLTTMDVTQQRELEREHALYVQQVVLVQEEERARLARELHDGIGQSVTSLLMSFGTLSDGSDGVEGVERLREATRAILDDLKRIAQGLHPAIIEDLGLEAAIRQMADQTREMGDVQVDCQIEPGVIEGLSRELQLSAFRLVQEALLNVYKHASAKTASVIMTQERERLCMIVEDDGCGFDVDAKSKAVGTRLGLVAMRERAQIHGGTLDVESTPGVGTTIYARLPLNEMPKE